MSESELSAFAQKHLNAAHAIERTLEAQSKYRSLPETSARQQAAKEKKMAKLDARIAQIRGEVNKLREQSISKRNFDVTERPLLDAMRMVNSEWDYLFSKVQK